MADTASVQHAPHDRAAGRHLLTEARIRSLSARPVGPMKVQLAHARPSAHR